ncbi:MAG: hypothetical protein JO128_02650 [Alphaproteobacteria bacterium]|nr:hypothetical protein [Alphaproteobacteria bacterium]
MTLIIPYGTAEWRPDAHGPQVTIDADARDPLRLNDGPYEFAELPPAVGTGTIAERLAILRDHLTEFCDQWAKRPRQFVALYFRFIDGVIAADRAAIDAHVTKFAGLFTAGDYAFSALRPLPRAHLPVGGDARVRVDFAFWTGAQLVSVDITADEARGGAWQERARQLEAAGIQRIEIPGASIAKDDPAVLHGALPSEFAAFWRSEPLPSSPFRAASLGEIVAGEPEF